MVNYKFDTTMKYKYTMNDNNEYHSFDDKPSLEYLDMSIISWHKDGKLHRIDKPALIRTLITGEIREEYYNDGKLHSYYDKDDITKINKACIDGYYYMGQKLSKDYHLSKNYYSKKYKICCNVCKNRCKHSDLYNETFDFIYCTKCNLLNEIEIINFNIKTFTNIEILELIKEYYNKNCPPDYKNRFIDINKITEDEITDINNPNFIKILYGMPPYLNSICKNIEIGHPDDDSEEFVLDKDTIFNLEYVYIILNGYGIDKSIRYSCYHSKYERPFDGQNQGSFAFNIIGDKVICDYCKGCNKEFNDCSVLLSQGAGLCIDCPRLHTHDSAFIKTTQTKKCIKCKKDKYALYENFSSSINECNMCYKSNMQIYKKK